MSGGLGLGGRGSGSGKWGNYGMRSGRGGGCQYCFIGSSLKKVNTQEFVDGGLFTPACFV